MTATAWPAVRVAYLGTVVSLVALMLLCVAWELWLAPLRPGGSWLVLKVLPLMACLFGVLRGRRRTFQVLSLVVWLYVAEGLTRAPSDPSPASARMAMAEVVLALLLFAATATFARLTRPTAAT